MSGVFKTPTVNKLAAELGNSIALWNEVISLVSEIASPLELEWKPSKTNFGAVCLLKKKKRTLLYMIPEPGTFRVAIILGERALSLAMHSTIPEPIKTMFREARKYAEGTGIRFVINSKADIATVTELVTIKLIPK